MKIIRMEKIFIIILLKNKMKAMKCICIKKMMFLILLMINKINKVLTNQNLRNMKYYKMKICKPFSQKIKNEQMKISMKASTFLI